MDRAKYFLIVPVLLLLLAMTASNIGAVSPSPEAVEKWRLEGVLEEKLSNLAEFKKHGGCSPAEHSPFAKKDRSDQLALAPVPDTANVLVILVELF